VAYAYWLSSGSACWLICRCLCRDWSACVYRHPLCLLVDLSVGVLAMTWPIWHSIIRVWRSYTSRMVIVRGRGCLRFQYSNTTVWKLLLRQQLVSYDLIGSIDWKGLIRGWFRSQCVVVNCHRSKVTWDCWIWVGVLFGTIPAIVTSKQIRHCIWHCHRPCILHCIWHCDLCIVFGIVISALDLAL